MKLKKIQDQVVVIVGASSGIGRATALKMAERGAHLVLAARSAADLELLVNEIRQKGAQAVYQEGDVSDYTQVKAIADKAIEAFGRIDTWVHLAAVSMYATFEETMPDEFRRIVEVNLLGQAYGAKVALPHLRREGQGALIHVSSVEGRRALPLQSAYAASKHGMVGMLDALRSELRHDGTPISVTNIMPSGINTPFFEKARTRLGVKPRPIAPVYEPELVAEAILYAAEHPVRELVVGGAGGALSWMQRLVPGAADAAVEKMGFIGQRTDQPKPESAPSNLYEHLPGHSQVHGSFSKEARSVSLYTQTRLRPSLRMILLAAGLLGIGALSMQVIRNRQIQRSPVNRMKRSLGRIINRRTQPTLLERAAMLGTSLASLSGSVVASVRHNAAKLADLGGSGVSTVRHNAAKIASTTSDGVQDLICR